MRSTYPSHNIPRNEVHQKNLELHSSMHIADEDAIMDEVEQSKLVLSYTLQHFHAQTQSHICCIPNTAANIPLFRAHRCNRYSPAWQKTKVLPARVRKNILYLLYYGEIASPPVHSSCTQSLQLFLHPIFFFYNMNYYH